MKALAPSVFVSLIALIFASSAFAAGKKADAKPSEKSVALTCEGDIALSGLTADAAEISFTEKKETSKAKLNGMDECKANAGKFLCYHANGETMINVPTDITSKKKGDKVTVFVNDDADDVAGNGKSHNCTVN